MLRPIMSDPNHFGESNPAYINHKDTDVYSEIVCQPY